MTQSSFRRRRDSSEIEVFDATRYFSDSIDVIGFSSTNTTILSHAPNLRRSFEVPIKSLKANKENTNKEQEKKEHKQLSSPRLKLVSFLNSLFFPQTASKKKKKKAKSLKDVREKKNNSSALMVGHKEIKSNAIWKKREEEKRMEMNDNESDSSSDLFELKSFDFSHLSFGLPVYGDTDHARVIRRGCSSFSSITF